MTFDELAAATGRPVHPGAYGLIFQGRNCPEVAFGATIFVEPVLPEPGEMAVIYPKDGGTPLIASPLTSCKPRAFGPGSDCFPAITFEHIDASARCFSLPQTSIAKIERVFHVVEPARVEGAAA